MSEILGTLFGKLASLIGVAAVCLVLYSVFGANKTSQAISDLNQLQTNVHSLYNTQSSLATLTNSVAITGGLAPARMISGTTLVNPWSGTVTIKVNAVDNTKFDVTETNIPNDSCAKLATNTPSVVGLSVNGSVQALPVDAGTIVTKCNANDRNTMIFTFNH